MPALERSVADQAAGLRRLLLTRETRLLALSGADADQVAALALQLALASERDGLRTLLIDLTRGALARQLGCRLRYELMHVIDSHRSLEQVLVAGPQDIPLLPAARGVPALAAAWRGRARFAEYVERAGSAPQLAVAVTPPEQFDALARVADHDTLLVLSSTGAADLKACYSALKRAHAACAAPPRLVCTDGLDPGAALEAHVRLSGTARSFLGREPEMVGRLCARPEPGVRGGPPALTIEALARMIRRWPLPGSPAAAGTPSLAGSPFSAMRHPIRAAL
jgi:hypothetical protein